MGKSSTGARSAFLRTPRAAPAAELLRGFVDVEADPAAIPAAGARGLVVAARDHLLHGSAEQRFGFRAVELRNHDLLHRPVGIEQGREADVEVEVRAGVAGKGALARRRD